MGVLFERVRGCFPSTGIAFGRAHGSEVATGDRDGGHETEGQDRVEVVGEGIEEHPVGAGFDFGYLADGGIDEAELQPDPRADQGERRHRGGGAVNEIGEFRPRNPERVGDGSHGLADDKRIRVIVEEERDAHAEGRQLAAAHGARPRRDESHDAVDAAVARNDPDQAAEHQG